MTIFPLVSICFFGLNVSKKHLLQVIETWFIFNTFPAKTIGPFLCFKLITSFFLFEMSRNVTISGFFEKKWPFVFEKTEVIPGKSKQSVSNNKNTGWINSTTDILPDEQRPNQIILDNQKLPNSRKTPKRSDYTCLFQNKLTSIDNIANKRNSNESSSEELVYLPNTNMFSPGNNQEEPMRTSDKNPSSKKKLYVTRVSLEGRK
jgi:hypothetical protein